MSARVNHAEVMIGNRGGNQWQLKNGEHVMRFHGVRLQSSSPAAAKKTYQRPRRVSLQH